MVASVCSTSRDAGPAIGFPAGSAKWTSRRSGNRRPRSDRFSRPRKRDPDDQPARKETFASHAHCRIGQQLEEGASALEATVPAPAHANDRSNRGSLSVAGVRICATAASNACLRRAQVCSRVAAQSYTAVVMPAACRRFLLKARCWRNRAIRVRASAQASRPAPSR
jgi:hypothetical protein